MKGVVVACSEVKRYGGGICAEGARNLDTVDTARSGEIRRGRGYPVG